jgi:hypothetical protein
MSGIDEDLIWKVGFFILQYFVSDTRPPEVEETDAQLQIGLEAAKTAYQELHRRDAIYLEPGTLRIRMAFPFSAVPTPHRVQARGKSYWANCAWDALAIPAAMHCEADIDTSCAENQKPIFLMVRDGRIVHQGECVHFLLPFQRWYNDLAYT